MENDALVLLVFGIMLLIMIFVPIYYEAVEIKNSCENINGEYKKIDTQGACVVGEDVIRYDYESKEWNIVDLRYKELM